MVATFRMADNINEVLEQLDAIVHETESNSDRSGFFAALYHKVTLKVKEGIDDNLFENGARLAELDVLFANRYLYAYSEWKKNPQSNTISKSWKMAFQNHAKSSHLILQHLLLGMNAHINYDLGIAVVEAAHAGESIDDLRKDYNTINTILASLSHEIFNAMNAISPLLSFLGFSGTKSNSMLVQFSLSNARDGSWCFATDLYKIPPLEYEDFLMKRDSEIESLGNLLVKRKGFLKIGIFLIYLFEWKNPARIINLLHTHQSLSLNQIKK